MKKKFIIKSVLYILVVVFMLHTSPYVFAHSASQEGILAKSYHAQYGGYYIGGEDVGWSIDEGFHTNGTTLTYSFSSTDTYLTSAYKSYVTSGASMWSGTVNIINKTDGSGTGQIDTFYDSDTYIVAKFYDYYADSNTGHLISWKISMNRAYNQSAVVLAHELGHAIGLNDLYASKNSGKLMYGYTDTTATSPTTSDKWGAKVITGVHSSHTWGYKYYSTNSVANVHIKYCTTCNGRSLITEQCRYNANNVCIKCGTPKGAQPYSVEDPILSVLWQ